MVAWRAVMGGTNAVGRLLTLWMNQSINQSIAGIAGTKPLSHKKPNTRSAATEPLAEETNQIPAP